MVYMSSILAAMNDGQRQAYYLDCANAALAHYDLGAISIHFIQHNAGIAYRLETLDDAARFLLKIHESAGNGLMDSPAQLAAQMAWLQALTEDGSIPVQCSISVRGAELRMRRQCAARQAADCQAAG